MMNQLEKEQILTRIQTRLTELAEKHHVDLTVDKDDSKFEDDWLYVTVGSADNIRVSDYAEMLSTVEKELRKDSIRNVLLVPVCAA